MSLWDDILAYDPELLWKLGEEPSGPVAVDSSGNGRAGTFVNGPYRGHPSIIPSLPEEKSVRLSQGLSNTVSRNHESWMLGDEYTIGFWFKRNNWPGAGERQELFGKVQSSRLTLGHDGFLQFYTYGPGTTDILQADAIVILDGEPHFLSMSSGPSGKLLAVDGVSVEGPAHVQKDTIFPLRLGHSGVSGSTNKHLDGWVQGFFWLPVELDATQHEALYEAGATLPPPPPPPPDAPLGFIAPVAGDSFNLGSIISVAWEVPE